MCFFIARLLFFLLFSYRIFSWHLSFPLLAGEESREIVYPFLPHLFSLNQLASHKGAAIKVGLIDNCPYLSKKFNGSFLPDMQGHCTFLRSLINSKVWGVAEHSIIESIEAFDKNGYSSKKNLQIALQAANERECDLICLGFKIEGTIDPHSFATQHFENLLTMVPSVAAAGNNLPDGSEAYPARLPIVPFDVGSFGWKDGRAFIPSFSSYQKNTGPLFVMPGVEVEGAWPGLNESAIKSGTSISAALLTGALAIIFGEFKKTFSSKEIITACYCSTLKMHDTFEWQQKVVLGVLDVRMALLMLLIIKKLKEESEFNEYSFTDNGFLQTCLLTRELLIKPLREYASFFAIEKNFETNFIEYWQEAQKVAVAKASAFLNTWKTISLANAINQLVSQLKKILLEKAPHLHIYRLPETAYKRFKCMKFK